MGIFCNAISGASAQREGVQRSKSEGKYRGRSPAALAKTDQVIELLQAGKTHRAVARELEISVRSVYRCLNERGLITQRSLTKRVAA
jgi:DNA invertase Pin-like site-specific DNA recombinase